MESAAAVVVRTTRRPGRVLMLSLVWAVALPAVRALSTAAPGGGTGVAELLRRHASDVSELRRVAADACTAPPSHDVFYLRYCLASPDDAAARAASLRTNLAWRATNDGAAVCDGATAAVAAALAGATWDNDPVRDAAPHAAIVNAYVSTRQILTTTSPRGDLVYCVRAGRIDDGALMAALGKDGDGVDTELAVARMVSFFLYCKEINAQVADRRSLASDRLVRLVTINDLAGVKLVGGDKSFRAALSQASTRANDLYPELSGPTLLVNLPPLLGALVKVFTPLFPPAVRKKLKFEKGVLDKNNELEDYLAGTGKARQEFENDLERLVYKSGDWD